MARTREQIIDALRANLTSIDNRLDLKVGPLWDYLISPIPTELATLESRIESLKRYYSPRFALVATREEARDFATNFGTGPSIGNFARATVVFYKNSAPSRGIVYSIPIGSLVQTIDGTLVFRTLQAVTMYGDYAETYFNAARQRYEVQVVVQAVAPGTVYNIPAGHIRRMQPGITGFDSIEQISDAVGGTEPEDSFEVAIRVQEKFKGLERNSIGGIATRIKEYASTYVSTVSVVKPSDRLEFRRFTQGPSLDVYVSGENLALVTEEYLALGGETTIPLNLHKTMTSITSITLNGLVLDPSIWRFIPDTTLEYRLSTRANPTIQLTTALVSNTLVEITGYRNDLLNMVQDLFSFDNAFFYTDVLVRSFMLLPVLINLECRIISADPNTVHDQIRMYCDTFIRDTSSTLIPEVLKDFLREGIPEIESIKLLEFRRTTGASDVIEVISPLKNQVAIFDSVASSITVRL